MANQTIHDKLVAALEARGEKRVEARTQKYTVLTRSRGGFWYVGRAGALRYGLTASKSSAAFKTKDDLLGIVREKLLSDSAPKE